MKTWREYSRIWRDKNPNGNASISKRWRTKYPERALASLRKYRASNPEKTRAYDAVKRAIKTGKLTRLACEVCADPKTHAHHSDYSKPLDVSWLCAKHHKVNHRKKD